MQNDTLTAKRFEELAERAEVRHTTEYTDFLNLDEISTLKSSGLDFALFGGYDGAERCIAAFGERPVFPITCVKLEAKSKRFAEKLTHRDYLGTILGTGIERSLTGDILINGTDAYVFCSEKIADYIIQSVDRVRHTAVVCSIEKELPEFINEKPDITVINISSLRLDALIAAVYRLSRNEAAKLISAEKVFINARLETKESKPLNESDVVSVRGKGKFIFEGIERKTKKDRLVAAVRIYK